MIEFKNVHKAFGTKKILRGLNLKINEGEVFFILGRSGTGKSVALKHLVGLLKADQGEIYLDGTPLHKCNEKDFQSIRRKCNIVFQLPALIDSRTVFENVTMGIRDLDLKTQIERCLHMLREVNLEKLIPHISQRYPPECSYGEQKRLAVARALVIDPSYILFDEPTTGLDPITSIAIHDLIKKVSKNLGKTSIVVSHDMRNALKTADRIAVLDQGQVVDSGSPEVLLKSQHPLTRAFLEDLHDQAELSK